MISILKASKTIVACGKLFLYFFLTKKNRVNREAVYRLKQLHMRNSHTYLYINISITPHHCMPKIWMACDDRTLKILNLKSRRAMIIPRGISSFQACGWVRCY